MEHQKICCSYKTNVLLKFVNIAKKWKFYGVFSQCISGMSLYKGLFRRLMLRSKGAPAILFVRNGALHTPPEIPESIQIPTTKE